MTSPFVKPFDTVGNVELEISSVVLVVKFPIT